MHSHPRLSKTERNPKFDMPAKTTTRATTSVSGTPTTSDSTTTLPGTPWADDGADETIDLTTTSQTTETHHSDLHEKPKRARITPQTPTRKSPASMHTVTTPTMDLDIPAQHPAKTPPCPNTTPTPTRSYAAAARQEAAPIDVQAPLRILPTHPTALYEYIKTQVTPHTRTYNMDTLQDKLAYDKYGRTLPPRLLEHLYSTQPFDLDMTADDLNHVFSPPLAHIYSKNTPQGYLTLAQNTHDNMIEALRSAQMGFILHPNYNNNRLMQKEDHLPTLSSWSNNLRLALEALATNNIHRKGWLIYPASDPHLTAELHLLCDSRAVSQQLLPYAKKCILFKNVRFLKPPDHPSLSDPFALEEMPLPFTQPIVALLVDNSQQWHTHEPAEYIDLAPPSTLHTVLNTLRLSPPTMKTLRLDLDGNHFHLPRPPSLFDIHRVLTSLFQQPNSATASTTSTQMPVNLLAAAHITFSPLPSYVRLSLPLPETHAHELITALRRSPENTHFFCTILEDLLEEDQYFANLTPSIRKTTPLLQVMTLLRSITTPAQFFDLYPRTSSSFFLRIRQTMDLDDGLRSISRALFTTYNLNLFRSASKELIRFAGRLTSQTQSLSYRTQQTASQTPPDTTTLICPRSHPQATIMLTAALFGHYHSFSTREKSLSDPYNISHHEFTLVYSNPASAILAHKRIVDGIEFKYSSHKAGMLEDYTKRHFSNPTPTDDDIIEHCSSLGASEMLDRLITQQTGSLRMGLSSTPSPDAPPPHHSHVTRPTATREIRHIDTTNNGDIKMEL